MGNSLSRNASSLKNTSEHSRLAGYAFLIEGYGLSVLPNWHASSVRTAGGLRAVVHGDRVETEYPPSYWTGDGLGNHLEFTLS